MKVWEAIATLQACDPNADLYMDYDGEMAEVDLITENEDEGRVEIL